MDAATPASGGTALLDEYTPRGGQVALRTRPFRRLSLAALPGEIVLSRSLSSTSRRKWTEMTSLAAGRVQISGLVVGTPAGHMRVTTWRTPPLEEWDVATSNPRGSERSSLPVAL